MPPKGGGPKPRGARRNTTTTTNTMTTDTLHTLAQKIQDPDHWEQALEYFIDHADPDPNFLDRCEKTNIPIVTEMLARTAAQWTGTNPVQLINPIILRHPDYNLIHGLAQVKNCIITFVYLTDINRGVATIIDPAAEKTVFASRCTLMHLGGDGTMPPETYTEPYNLHPN